MKKYFIYGIFMMLFIILSGLPYAAAAPTEPPALGTTPEGTGTPGAGQTPAAPTPVLHEIGSIGDFNLKAGYADNSAFVDDMAVLVKEIRESEEAEVLIQAVRAAERDQDIFSIFHMTLQKNGRDTEFTKQMNIRIEQSGVFASYDNISVYGIDDAGTARKLETKIENGYICYTADAMGTFALTGMLLPDHTEAPSPSPVISPTLQNDGNTGIIPPSQSAAGNGSENREGVVTPGAFVFWLILALLVGIWVGIGIGYILWGRYKTKKNYTGPKVIGE